MELKNKKVLITGGSAGIGKAIVKEFIQHGVKDIAVVGRRKEPLEMLKAELKSVNLITIQADVSAIKDLNKVVSVISQEWGMLDILINSAGVVSANGLLFSGYRKIRRPATKTGMRTAMASTSSKINDGDETDPTDWTVCPEILLEKQYQRYLN